MSTTTYANPQAIFYQHFEAMRRDEMVGILLALFLGTFGVHHFYLRRTGLGILYCLFCWTSIPTFLGFVECFFMPGRVRDFNAMQAAGIAASLGIPVPMWGTPPNTYYPPAGYGQLSLAAAETTCSNCQRSMPAGAKFCSGCGTAV